MRGKLVEFPQRRRNFYRQDCDKIRKSGIVIASLQTLEEVYRSCAECSGCIECFPCLLKLQNFVDNIEITSRRELG